MTTALLVTAGFLGGWAIVIVVMVAFYKYERREHTRRVPPRPAQTRMRR